MFPLCRSQYSGQCTSLSLHCDVVEVVVPTEDGLKMSSEQQPSVTLVHERELHHKNDKHHQQEENIRDIRTC